MILSTACHTAAKKTLIRHYKAEAHAVLWTADDQYGPAPKLDRMIRRRVDWKASVGRLPISDNRLNAVANRLDKHKRPEKAVAAVSLSLCNDFMAFVPVSGDGCQAAQLDRHRRIGQLINAVLWVPL